MAVIARRFLVHGDVQGVGFRFYTIREASPLRITGYVRNLPQGEVEVLAEGPEEDVSALLERVRRGPRAARVDRVDVTECKPSGRYDKFGVTF